MKRRLHRWLARRARRPPDVVIGAPRDPYMLRWHILPRNPICNVYLHRFLKSDDERALHDHPWWNVSYLLDGEYTEHTIPAGGVHVRKIYKAGDLKFRGASAAHRIELHAGPCWTLFITGPRFRRWGFHCPNGWRHWKEFVQPERPGEIGRGCE